MIGTNQSATIALGTAKVEGGGIPELAAYIKNEGIEVTYAKIGRSVELGIFSGFIILFTGGIIRSCSRRSAGCFNRKTFKEYR